MDKLQMKEIRKQVRAAVIESLTGDDFSGLQSFVDELNATNSKNNKIEIIQATTTKPDIKLIIV